MRTATTTLVKHLDHLNLTVADLDASLDFYGRVFGFARVEGGVQDDGTRWAIVRAGEALLCLYEKHGLAQYRYKERIRRGLHGVNHFALRITDRAAWEATIEREGLSVSYGGAIEWPHSTAWYVNDPTGHEIEVALWHQDTIGFEPAA
jgi:catechol 2,3-dioxygenase-like lactoylglutathione lyase family enzyme